MIFADVESVMDQIREILPGIFQYLRLKGKESQAAIYVKRVFGNYLFYRAPPHPDLFRLMRAQGGLVKYFHDSSFEGEGADRFFTRFGASSVFLEAPIGYHGFRWELYHENKQLYQGVRLIELGSIPHAGFYLVNHRGYQILLSDSILALKNGHWMLRQALNRYQILELVQILEELKFDYLIPQYSSGYISFQKVEPDFKKIQLRHLMH